MKWIENQKVLSNCGLGIMVTKCSINCSILVDSIQKKIAKLRQICDSFCVPNLEETTFVCIIAIDNFGL